MENNMLYIILLLAGCLAGLVIWYRRRTSQAVNEQHTIAEDDITGSDGRIQYHELVTQGHTAVRDGDYQAALDFSAKAIAIQPAWGLAYYLRGQTYHQLGDYDAAVTAYESAIQYGLPDALQTKATERLWLARSLTRTDL